MNFSANVLELSPEESQGLRELAFAGRCRKLSPDEVSRMAEIVRRATGVSAAVVAENSALLFTRLDARRVSEERGRGLVAHHPVLLLGPSHGHAARILCQYHDKQSHEWSWRLWETDALHAVQWDDPALPFSASKMAASAAAETATRPAATHSAARSATHSAAHSAAGLTASSAAHSAAGLTAPSFSRSVVCGFSPDDSALLHDHLLHWDAIPDGWVEESKTMLRARLSLPNFKMAARQQFSPESTTLTFEVIDEQEALRGLLMFAPATGLCHYTPLQ